MRDKTAVTKTEDVIVDSILGVIGANIDGKGGGELGLDKISKTKINGRMVPDI